MTNIFLAELSCRLRYYTIKRWLFLCKESALTSLHTVKNSREGNKISRFFRYIFEYKKIRSLFGVNVALMVFASSFLPKDYLTTTEPEEVIVTQMKEPLTTLTTIRYPVESVSLSQGYGIFHPGIDLRGLTGSSVNPIMGGTVEEVSLSKFGYGNMVIIDHGNDITSLYAHLSKIEVSRGDKVTSLTEIGKMGATGHATGPHVHLEIRDHGRLINPFSILPSIKQFN
jgi:murein DD-endopeptidase MepM/ murein hydrolase activator NlpD